MECSRAFDQRSNATDLVLATPASLRKFGGRDFGRRVPRIRALTPQSTPARRLTSWFGKNSTQGKLQRLLGEIQIHMRLKVSGDRREIRQSYLPTLFEKLVKPIQEQGTPAVEGVIELMDEYYLTKEDWDALVELGVGEGYDMEGVLKAVSTQTKSAFTRMYNKGEHPVPFYKAEAGKPSKKLAASGPAPDLEDAFVEEEELAEEDDEADGDGNADGDEGSEADLSKDKLIRNKAAGSGAAGKKAPAKPRAKAVPKAKK